MKRKNTGITLIALVITIIVLLILAGVSISAVMGENGILTKTKQVKDKTLQAQAKEKIEIAIIEYESEQNSEGKTLKEYLEKAGATEVTKSGTTGKIDGYEFNIQNNSVTIKTQASKNLTLKDVYGTEMLIGQKITYTANNQNNWIVFGKDINGNILITTELPIDGSYDLERGAHAWLSYEQDLHTICSAYAGNIQGVDVIARSITMEDINFVAGFNKPNLGTVTLGTIQNGGSEAISYYYPNISDTSVNNWENPANKAKTFEINEYAYYTNWNDGVTYYYGADTDNKEILATEKNINLNNLQYIWGGNTKETAYNEYAVASKSVEVKNTKQGTQIWFLTARVGDSEAHADCLIPCRSTTTSGDDRGGGVISTLGVRPIVVLPDYLEVKVNEDGLYDLIY